MTPSNPAVLHIALTPREIQLLLSLLNEAALFDHYDEELVLDVRDKLAAEGPTEAKPVQKIEDVPLPFDPDDYPVI
jgi:hypothetical protein